MRHDFLKGLSITVTDALRTLMVTSDPVLIADFTHIARELGVEAQASATFVGVPEELSGAKYEGVLLDFDIVPSAMAILSAVRNSRSNKQVVVFAVVTDTLKGHQALERGATLILERPLDARQIRRAIYLGYDLMLRERRRYFRCAIEAPVLVTEPKSGLDFSCRSINISSTGIALKTPCPFKTGEELQIIVFLRDGDLAIRATATVVWDDRHGKTGLSFKCSTPRDQNDLEGWLDSQLGPVPFRNRHERAFRTSEITSAKMQ